MDKVKIKRVKRNKKKVTTAEKIMAGIGVGSTLMGGAGVVTPKTEQQQFVRTQSGQSSKTGSKIKDVLKNIFGSTIGVDTAKADDLAALQAAVDNAQAQVTSAQQAVSNFQAWVDKAESDLNDPYYNDTSVNENAVQDRASRQADIDKEINTTGKGYNDALSSAQQALTDAQQALSAAQAASNPTNPTTPTNPTIPTTPTTPTTPTPTVPTKPTPDVIPATDTHREGESAGNNDQGRSSHWHFDGLSWVKVEDENHRVQNPNGLYYVSDGYGNWNIDSSSQPDMDGASLNQAYGGNSYQAGITYRYSSGSWTAVSAPVNTPSTPAPAQPNAGSSGYSTSVISSASSASEVDSAASAETAKISSWQTTAINKYQQWESDSVNWIINNIHDAQSATMQQSIHSTASSQISAINNTATTETNAVSRAATARKATLQASPTTAPSLNFSGSTITSGANGSKVVDATVHGTLTINGVTYKDGQTIHLEVIPGGSIWSYGVDITSALAQAGIDVGAIHGSVDGASISSTTLPAAPTISDPSYDLSLLQNSTAKGNDLLAVEQSLYGVLEQWQQSQVQAINNWKDQAIAAANGDQSLLSQIQGTYSSLDQQIASKYKTANNIINNAYIAKSTGQTITNIQVTEVHSSDGAVWREATLSNYGHIAVRDGQIYDDSGKSINSQLTSGEVQAILAAFAAATPVTVSNVNASYNDQQLIAGANDITYNSSISDAQLQRIASQLSIPSTGVKPGSVLAYMLSLGPGTDGVTQRNGSDGKTYYLVNNIWTSTAPTGATTYKLDDNLTTTKTTTDINGSRTGLVTVNGQSMTITVTISDGKIYDGNGNDITSKFSSSDAAKIITAFRAQGERASSAAADFISNVATKTLDDYSKLSDLDKIAVQNYFNSHPDAIPKSFAANSFTAYGLNMSQGTTVNNGVTSKVISGVTYYLSADGSTWSTTNPNPVKNGDTRVSTNSATGRSVHQTYDASSGKWQDTPVDGDTDSIASGSVRINYIYSGGKWVMLDGQMVSGEVLNTLSNSTNFTSGIQYISSGGKWVSTTVTKTLITAADVKAKMTELASKNWNEWSSSDLQQLLDFYSNGQNQNLIPSSFSAGSFYAYALGLGGSASGATTSINGINYSFDGNNWVAAGTTAGTVYKDGDTRGSSGGIQVYHKGQWVAPTASDKGIVFTDGSGVKYAWDGSKWVAQTVDIKTLKDGTTVGQTVALGPNSVAVWTGTAWRTAVPGDTFTDPGTGAKYVLNSNLNWILQGSSQAVATKSADGKTFTVTMGSLTFTGTSWADLISKVQDSYNNGYKTGTSIDLTTYNALTAAITSVQSGTTVSPSSGVFLISYGNVNVIKDPATGTYKITVMTNGTVVDPTTNKSAYNLVLSASSMSDLQALVKKAITLNSTSTGIIKDQLQGALDDLKSFQNSEKNGDLKFTYMANPVMSTPGGSYGQNPTQYATLDTANQVVAMLANAGITGGTVTQVKGYDGSSTQYQITFPNSSYMGDVGILANLIQTNGIDAAVNFVKTSLAEAGGDYSTRYVGVGSGGSVGYTVNNNNSVNNATTSVFSFTTGSGNTSTVGVGDTWQIKITGSTPNTAVYLTLKDSKGNVVGKSQVGTTDANGNFILTSSSAGQRAFSTADIGNWNETWSVGDTTVGTANFAVNTKAATTFTPTWMQNVTETNTNDGSVTPMNSMQFATLETAQYYANLLGGTVVAVNYSTGPFKLSQPMYMIQIGNTQLNAGLVANEYKTYGAATASAMVQADLSPTAATQNNGGASANLSTSTNNPGNNSTTTAVATAPVVSSLSISHGKAGDTVTITGSNFNTTASSNQVEFLNSAGAVLMGVSPASVSATSLTFVIPNIATGSYSIRVTNLSARVGTTSNYTIVNSNTKAFTVDSSGSTTNTGNPTDTTNTSTITLAAATVGQAYSQSLAWGTNSNVTWRLTSGSLPAGLSLSSSGVISGTPTAVGASTFTVSATTGSQSASQVFSITVNAAATTATATALASGVVGTAYSQALTASSLSTPTWSVISGSLPAGLSLNSATGTISGTPTTAGTYTFSLRATSGSSAISGTFSITISSAASTAASAPTITGTTGMSGAVGQSGILITINGTNLSGAVLSSVSGSGLAFSNVSVNADGTQILAYVSVSASAVAGTQSVIVTTPGGSVSQPFSITSATTSTVTASTLTSLSASSAAAGDTLTINGSNFSATAGNSIIQLLNSSGSVVASLVPTSVSASSLNFIVPSNLTVGSTYGVRVITLGSSLLASNTLSSALTITSASSQTNNTAVTLSLSASTVSLTVGQSGSITSTVTVNGSVQNGVSVSSNSNSGVATAAVSNGNVIITALSAGTTVLQIHPSALSASDTSQDKYIIVVVTGSSSATTKPSLSLSSNNAAVTAGYTATITASTTVNGTTTVGGVSIINNTNPSVASAVVDSTTGIIYISGLSAGTTVLQVHPTALSTSDTSQDKYITVTVSANTVYYGTAIANVGLSLSSSSAALTTGNSVTIYGYSTVNGSTSAGGISLVNNSNPSVASVSLNSSTGVITITGLSAGTTVLQVHPTALSTSDTSQDKYITITVYALSSGGGSVVTVMAGASSVQMTNLGGGSYYGQTAGYTPEGIANTNRPSGLAMPAGYSASGSQFADSNPDGLHVGTQTGGLQMSSDPAAQVAGSQTSTQTTYTVKKGDTLWSIAKKVYGNGNQWRKILEANPKSLSKPGNTKSLKVGAKLVIPQL